MRFSYEKRLLRVFVNWRRGGGEIAYLRLGLRGLGFVVEFPSTWHEQRLAWLTASLGLLSLGISVPWSKAAPNYHQCSGPKYGFQFFNDLLWLYFGQDTGYSNQRPRVRATFYMPWSWTHVRNDYLNPDGTVHHRAARGEYEAPEETKRAFPYVYKLASGEVQHRTATVSGSESEWRLRWFPWLPFPRKIARSIDVTFDDEVGEGTGSWKGGVLGCGYQWCKGDSLEQALRRMECARRFNR